MFCENKQAIVQIDVAHHAPLSGGAVQIRSHCALGIRLVHRVGDRFVVVIPVVARDNVVVEDPIGRKRFGLLGDLLRGTQHTCSLLPLFWIVTH